MSQPLRSFALGALFLTVGFFALSLGQGRADHDAYEERVSLRVARALAFVASVEPGEADGEHPAQRVLSGLSAALPMVKDALVIKGTKVIASTDPARVGQRLNPESLTDKDLYDAAGRIKAMVAKNAEERERSPELGRDAYSEVQISKSKTGRLIVGAPVKAEGRFTAMVRLETEPSPPPTTIPKSALGVLIAAVLLFALLARPLKGWGAVAGGALVLLGALFADIQLTAAERAGRRLAESEQEAALYGKLAGAGVYAAVGPADRPALLDQIRLDAAGVAVTDLVAIRSATVATPAPAGTVQIAEPPFVVDFREAYYLEQHRSDLKLLAQWGGAFFLISVLALWLGTSGRLNRGWRSLVKHRHPYYYMAPAMVGMVILVFIPVAFGIVLGFMDRRYNVWEFAGLSNYVAILSDLDVMNPQNFYFKFGVTVMWTLTNVGLHVSIGLFLALLLNDQMLKARGIFRVLLIVPWAIPNYITALIWRGLFHKQFGAVNIVLEGLGAEPIAWFQSFWPAFFTNLATNTWLGFPFMMVVSLGALQSIPGDLYEAAWVDGASRWQRFSRITLPLLMPALVPAVIMGVVWTFNMFNIIYLVSGGAPDGATDILITDAFRWAFERDKYGYAAAYSTLIFLILLTFTVATNRITGATKGVFE